MKKYNLINNITGWIIFIVATIVYLLTIEPTTSLWDCGEFIATAFKLEVGHPPGAPFFMILAKVFSLFTGDVTQVAKMVNAMSALASSFTILFLFWTITHFAKKIIAKNNEYSIGQLIAIMGSGIVGALAYTFSDTFWFSAVEGEVYALSSLFTAVVFWAILKWENEADQKRSNRWIILIAYLMGLSIGVHLLNLLAIPAIVLIYYFKKYEPTRNGVIGALSISLVILLSIMYLIIPGIIKVASWFELIFINGFGMPYNSGIIIYILSLGALIVWSLRYTIKHKKVVLNTIILVFTVILIGYSSFAMIVIRSIANPPMDENNPETVFALLSYLNREQYGDRPLVTGQYFNAPVMAEKETKATYTPIDGKYKITNRKTEYIYDKKITTLFPRMYSSKAEHIKEYKRWGNITGGKSIQVENYSGEMKTIKKPSFGNNLIFFFRYQIGHMYLRYFMWNFVGRQNDIQSHGEVEHGNWLSGIKPIDESRLGPQDNLPDEFANNKARNKYYFLPLILGLIGLSFHYIKNSKDFSVVLLLFFLTGIAIVIYLNQYPLQPRERDYAFAGSFYAFSIWIGLGVLGIYNLFKQKIPGVLSAGLATILCLALVPGLMASENWDDHDRSNRYTARDFAHNYLYSCAPNAILFTNGDNDTFPLWYAQEVEGIRTDVRIVNLALLNTDWYISEMKCKAYDSDPVPFSLVQDQYIQGTRDVVHTLERFDDFIDLKQAVDFMVSDNPKTKYQISPTESINYLPAKKLRLMVDKEAVLRNGVVKPELEDQILPYLDIVINKSYIEKKDLMILDLLAHNNWKRPVYFVSLRSSNIPLDNYFQLEGFAYRLVPIKTDGSDILNAARIETDILYDNVMNKFKWGNMNDTNVLIDHYNLRTITILKLRNLFSRLASNLIVEGKIDSAITVLDKAVELMPHEQVPYDLFVSEIVKGYYKANAFEKGNALATKLASVAEKNLTYYLSLNGRFANLNDYDKQVNMHILNQLMTMTKQYKQDELNKEIEKQFTLLYGQYVSTVKE